jgi:hypothetical protein
MADVSDNKVSWKVAQHGDEIGPGDAAFIWQTGKDRGIYGMVQIEDSPHEFSANERKDRFSRVPETDDYGVMTTITNRKIRLSHKLLRSTPGLEKLSVLQGGRIQMGTNFSVTLDEAKILLSLMPD